MTYYLIEKYKGYDSSSYRGESYTQWDVREYKSKAELEKAVLQGPRHSGKLIATKGLGLTLYMLSQGPYTTIL